MQDKRRGGQYSGNSSECEHSNGRTLIRLLPGCDVRADRRKPQRFQPERHREQRNITHELERELVLCTLRPQP